MSALLRAVRPCFAVLLVATLLIGLNGFLGAFHSVHHLRAPGSAHAGEADGHEDEQAPTPPETCQVAVAAGHSAAIGTEALPLVGTSTPEATLEPTRAPEAPRLAWKEPSTGRAPPSLPPLPS